MILFVGEGAGELYGLNTVVGEFRVKLEMTTKHAAEGSDVIIEVDDETYILLRPVLRAASYDYGIVINIPDVANPRSFLYEDDTQVVNIWNDDIQSELNKINTGMSEIDKEKEKYKEENISEGEEDDASTSFAKFISGSLSKRNKHANKC